MNEQKQTCEHVYNHEWPFCPMCGKPLKEKEWEPEVGKEYWWIDEYGIFRSHFYITYTKVWYDQFRALRNAGNLFNSQRAAEKHLAMVKCVDSQRELPKEGQGVFYLSGSGNIVHDTWSQLNTYSYWFLAWRLGFVQPDTPEGRALLEKNIREHKEWFE